MPKKLKQLLIDRVDLVAAGDNPGAKVSLFKEAPEGQNMEGGVGLGEWIARRVAVLLKKEKEKEKEKEVNNVFELQKFLDTLPEDQRKALQVELAKGQQLETATKALAEKETLVASLTTQVEQLTATSAAAATGTAGTAGKEDIFKGLSEEVRKVIQESQTRAEQAEAIAKRLQEASQTAEYVAKARSFQNLPVAAEVLGPILKGVAASNAEDFKTLESLLKATDEALSRNNVLLKELGTSRGAVSGSAWTKVETLAKELVTKSSTSSGAKMTKEQAIASVLRDDADLYAEYQKELREAQ